MKNSKWTASKWMEIDGVLQRGIDCKALRELNGKRPRLIIGGYIIVAIAAAVVIGIVYLAIRYWW